MATGPKQPVDARRVRAATQEESFLRRWSRRKDAAPPATTAAPVPRQDAACAPVLTDRDMPPVAGLNEQSDFSGFLSRGVSEALRRRARQDGQVHLLRRRPGGRRLRPEGEP
jgi:hypothetical protein